MKHFLPNLFAGKVYNVTAYMEYHPGGIPELMRGAGKDATVFFDEVSLALLHPPEFCSEVDLLSILKRI